MKRLLQAGWAVLVLWTGAGLGCGEPGSSAEDTSEDGGEPTPPPRFEDLPEGELVVSTSSHEDLTFAVADLRPETRIEIDGWSWRLGGAGPATHEDGSLHLALGGAMVVGRHELSLFHQAGSEELRSEIVTIEIEASAPGVLSASFFNPAVVDAGDRLLVHGQGGAALLGLIDDVGERAVVRAGAWQASGFELELPGLIPGAGVGGRALVDLSIATLGPAGPGGAQARWVIAAWLADDGARVRGRIASIDGPGDLVAEPGEVIELWSLDDPTQVEALGPHELARIHAVAILDRAVVIAVEARRDAEVFSPGDRLLVTRWLAASGEPALPVLLRGSGSGDLDLPGDARLWTYAGYESALGVRVGLGFPWLLRIASNGLPVLAEDPGEFSSVPFAATWMRSGEGAFGSRHVFALEDDPGTPRVRLLRINRWSEQAEAPSEVVDVLELPALPSGAPSLANLDGVPTLLMPMGPDDDALALRSTGAGALLEPVAGLRCDELALAGPGFDGVGDTLPLACLLAGELRVGALAVD